MLHRNQKGLKANNSFAYKVGHNLLNEEKFSDEKIKGAQ